MKLARLRLKKRSELGGTLCPKRATIKKLIFALALPALLVGCKSDDANDCSKAFDVTIKPTKIDDGKIYISPNSLDFLFQADYFTIDDADLIVTINGKKKIEKDLDLNLNGIKTNRCDGHKNIEKEDYDSAKSCTRSHFKPHKMYLNGSEDFAHFIKRVHDNKGDLVVRMHGDDDDYEHRVKEVSLELVGKTYSKANCPAPKPSPTPTVNVADYAPVITSTNPSKSPTNLSTMNISFSAKSTGGTFYCSLDGAAAAKCTSPANYVGLANGAHNFQVSGQTPGGVSAGAAASYSWTIDATAPDVTITNAASLPTLTNKTIISFSFSASKANSTYSCSLDGAAAAACTSPASYNTLADGQHYFQVWAIDSLGNKSAQPASFQWSIDTVLPITSILTVDPMAPVTNIATAQITFSASETSNFTCTLDNGVAGPCSSPVNYLNLPAGNHYFTVQATDLAGNQGLPVTYTWVTDYTAPVISLGSVVPAQGLTNSQNVSVEFTADKPVSYTCTFDNLTPTTCTSPFTSPVNTAGVHILVIDAQDLAGNSAAPVSVQWQMDYTAPIISFGQILPSANAYVNSTDVSFEVNSSKTSTLSATLNGVAVNATGTTISLNGLGEGNYTLSVSATDSVGNVSNTITHAFTVDLTAPSLTLSTTAVSPTNLDIANFTFSSNETVTYACNFDSAGFSACSNPLAISGIADGSHTFEVVATDLAGNQDNASFSWIVDTTAPQTNISANQQNKDVTFTLSSNESPVTFTCSLDNSPLVSCANVLFYTNLEAGPHLLTAYSTDAAGNTDPNGASYFFTVVPPIHTFINSTLPAKTITNSTSMVISFSASQSFATYNCRLDGGVVTTCFSPETFTGLADGVHTFIVKATDQWGVQDPVGATFTWTVDTVPPIVSNISFVIGTNSITVNYTTNKPATDQILYGVGGSANINQATTESRAFVTSHSVTVSGLSSNTLYTLEVAGHDQAGNAYVSIPPQSVRTHR